MVWRGRRTCRCANVRSPRDVRRAITSKPHAKDSSTSAYPAISHTEVAGGVIRPGLRRFGRGVGGDLGVERMFGHLIDRLCRMRKFRSACHAIQMNGSTPPTMKTTSPGSRNHSSTALPGWVM